MRFSALILSTLLVTQATTTLASPPSLLTPAPVRAPASSASAPVPVSAIEKALAFLNPAKGWMIDSKQKVDFDQKIWAREALSDGSEIFSLQAPEKKDEQKRAILRDGENLSSISSFELQPAKPGAKQLVEKSASVVFFKGDLFSITQCRDDGTKLGRNCLTVTPDVCDYIQLDNSKEVPNEVSQQLKVLEIRALATILTLRGTTHQLENVARHGNRLGLNNPLQTTKGKLISKNKDLVKRIKTDARALCTAFASTKT